MLHGVQEKTRSITGFAIFLGNLPIAWKTRKQKNVALSSCEAELNAIYDTAKELVSIRGLVSELCPDLLSYPVVLQTDSKSAIDVARTGGNAGSRHYTRTINFVRSEIEKGVLKLIYKSGKELSVDLLTKNVSGDKMRLMMERDYSLH